MGCGAAGCRNALHCFACGSREASTSQTGACPMERKGPASPKGRAAREHAAKHAFSQRSEARVL